MDGNNITGGENSDFGCTCKFLRILDPADKEGGAPDGRILAEVDVNLSAR